MYEIRPERIHKLTPGKSPLGSVIYWMSREQRVEDNPALLHAIYLAEKNQKQLQVVFTLTDDYPGAFLRHYHFMLHGLKEVAEKLRKLNIPFRILKGSPPEVLPKYVQDLPAGTVITDFDPLRVKRGWVKAVVEATGVCFLEVDGHNIVPARFVSNKVEYGAYTLRPKIHKLFEYFLEPYPSIKPLPAENYAGQQSDPPEYLEKLKIDGTVKPVDWIKPGEKAAMKALEGFLKQRLAGYDEKRNNPVLDHTSRLSPYLHFGQLFSGRVVREIYRHGVLDADSDALIEEMVVRKELSDNFCHYQPKYDSTEGFPSWAKDNLALHAGDSRPYTYGLKQFEEGITHDQLWNAAQHQMVCYGKMHGYMRMYWAKKILEWTVSVEEAMKIAIYLNDKYQLDGRDSNGYTGIAWSLGGVHDRAWTERPVFGKIRYMNYNGCKRKFDVEAYINKYLLNQKRLFDN